MGETQQKLSPTAFNNGVPRESDDNNHSEANVLRAFPPLETQPIDHFLHAQTNRLLRLQRQSAESYIEEQNRGQLYLQLKRLEEQAMFLMKEKEKALEHANRKSTELEMRLKRAAEEAESWRRLSEQNSAKVEDLNTKLRQARQRAWMAERNRAPEDAVSVVLDGTFAGKRNGDDKAGEKKKMAAGRCKRCRIGKACVVFLPCRHVCACRACWYSLQNCPTCGDAKEASLEVLYGDSDEQLFGRPVKIGLQ